MEKKYNNEDGVWRTIGGRKVFIRNGQSLSDAMKESGKFKNLQKDYKTAKELEKQKEKAEEYSKDIMYQNDETGNYENVFDKLTEMNEKETVKTRDEYEKSWEGRKDREIYADTSYEGYINSLVDSGKLSDKQAQGYLAKAKIEQEQHDNMLKEKFGISKENMSDEQYNRSLNNYREMNKAGTELNERIDKEKQNEESINSLRNLAQGKHNEDYNKYYSKYDKERQEYLKNYDRYSNNVRPEKMEGRDVWNIGYKESMYDQAQSAINNIDSYDLNGIENTLAIVEKEAPSSLHHKYLDYGGKTREQNDRKTYGDAKVDAAIMREQEMLRRGYTNISTKLAPSGMVNDFNYSDMIISGEKNGIEVSFNYNKNGESALSLKGVNNGAYSNLIITDKNENQVRNIISRGSAGGFQESRPYKDYEVKKLTIPESKEYYDKANAYYKENKDAHYYDNKFFNDYNEKLKDEIISRRGQTNMSNAIREKAYQKYMKEHPNSKMTLEQFLKKK